MNAIELRLSPRKSALRQGEDNILEVLARAAAPAPPAGAAPRKALNLALAIDRSGSMSGQPLAEAKRCAAAVIERMAPADFVSVIAYDDKARVIWPVQPRGDGAAAIAAIGSIHEGGTTALHDGWAAGAEQAAHHRAPDVVSRVLLLSDGCANVGLTDPHCIADHCRQMAEKGVTTSTYGLGRSFNEELMLAMARAGGGNGYYGQTAEDLMGPFQQEFDLLQALFATRLRLSIDPAPRVGVEVVNQLARRQGAWLLPDLAYGSEAWALLRLAIPRALVGAGAPSQVRLLAASLAYEVGGTLAAAGPVSLTLPALPAAAHDALVEDEFVVRRAQELGFAAYQGEAAVAARHGDWGRVNAILACAHAEAEGNPWLGAAMASLELYAAARDRERFAKEASFKSARMMTRLAERDESAEYGAAFELEKPSFLRRRQEEGKGDQTGA